MSNLQAPPSFSGSGNTLSGRSNPPASSSAKGKAKEESKPASSASASAHSWGSSGQALGKRAAPQTGPVGAGGARAPQPPQRGGKTKARSPSPEEEEEEEEHDWGVDDDDVIMIDSD